MNKFRWIVEIEVDEIWVADGFNLDRERLINMLGNELSFAVPEQEFNGRIITAPSEDEIMFAQGYGSYGTIKEK